MCVQEPGTLEHHPAMPNRMASVEMCRKFRRMYRMTVSRFCEVQVLNLRSLKLFEDQVSASSLQFSISSIPLLLTMQDNKDTVQHVEKVDGSKAVHEETIDLPSSLAGLSEDELKKLGVKTITKLDLVIMPALVILYVL